MTGCAAQCSSFLDDTTSDTSTAHAARALHRFGAPLCAVALIVGVPILTDVIAADLPYWPDLQRWQLLFAGASLAGRISSAIALSSVVRVARTAAWSGAFKSSAT